MNILEKVIVFCGLTYVVYAFIDVIVQRIKYNRKQKTCSGSLWGVGWSVWKKMLQYLIEH